MIAASTGVAEGKVAGRRSSQTALHRQSLREQSAISIQSRPSSYSTGPHAGFLVMHSCSYAFALNSPHSMPRHPISARPFSRQRRPQQTCARTSADLACCTDERRGRSCAPSVSGSRTRNIGRNALRGCRRSDLMVGMADRNHSITHLLVDVRTYRSP